MLTVFLFDEGGSRREVDLRAALDRLADDALLWIALLDPTEEEVAAVQEALELSDKQAERLLEQPSQASLVDAGEHLHVTLYAASSEGGEPVLRSARMRARPELGRHRSSRRDRGAGGVPRTRRRGRSDR